MKSNQLSLSALALIISTPFSALANNEDTIVVTASGFDQQLRDAPASITVISHDELSKRPFSNLIDAVKDIEGVSITGTSNDSQDISVRGLPAEYTLILVDGKRQNSRESRPNGSGGFESGFIPPQDAIERIEVIRGPMSSLYGSDAMGGVINIITRKKSKEWQGSIGLDTTVQENAASGNMFGGNFFLSGPLVENYLTLQLYGQGNIRSEDDIIGGYNKNDNKGVTAKVIYTPTEDHDITFEMGRTVQKRESTPGKSIDEYTIRGGIKQPNPKTDTNNARNLIALTHTGRWDSGVSEFSIQREQAERTTQTFKLDTTTGSWNGGYDDRKPEILNHVINGKYTLPLANNMLTVGGQYQHARLKDDSTIGRNQTESARISSNQYALFVEDELSINENLAITGGIRMDDHEKFGSQWNPRGYIVYHLTDEVTLRGGVAKAFRAPTLREMSSNYGTATQGGAGIMYGNSDLKPETSFNQEVGAAYDHESGFNASVTLFNTDFKNKLTSYSKGSTDPLTGLNLYVYDNVGKANIKGVEIASGSPITDSVKVKVNYTFTHSKRKSDDEFFSSGVSLKGQPLAQTPKHSAGAKIDWRINEAVNAYTQVSYIGKQVWAGQRNSHTGPRYRSGYTAIDMGGNYQLNTHTQLNFAVLNITDETGDKINTKGGNWTINDGRRYWLGINVSF